MRAAWLIVGCVSLVVGAAGIVLPMVPTTPFLLLSAWAFARSSERFHLWLVRHPVLGPPIAAWQERRAISRKAKTAAMISLACAVGLSVVLDAPRIVIILQLVAIVPVTMFILTRPEQ